MVASLLGGDQVGVDWDAPATGPAPDGYSVEITDDAGANWTFLGSTAAGVTDLQTTLGFGTYQFRIYASNSVGNSPYGGPSNAVTLVAPEAPGAPTNVAASLTPENFVHVEWDAPTTGDAPTQYNYEYSANGGSTWLNLGGGGTVDRVHHRDGARHVPVPHPG